MDNEIIYCDECDAEAIYKWDGIFLCTACLKTTFKKEVRNGS